MEFVHPNKVRNQLARAHRLVDVIESLPGTAADHHEFAAKLTAEQWAEMVAVVADHRTDLAAEDGDENAKRVVRFEDRTPSDETIAMAIQILETAATNEALTADEDFMAFAGVR